MKISLSPILTIALSVFVLFFSGCNDKQNDKNPFRTAADNTTSSVTTEETVSLSAPETNRTGPSESGVNMSDAVNDSSFLLADQHGIQYHISIENEHLQLKDESTPLIILNFFSTWSIPCRGEAPYLTQLEEEYAPDVLVIGILLHPDDHLDTLENFIKENNADFFISSSSDNDRFAAKVTETLGLSNMIPIPLTVMYHHGTYARHYEGAVPVEMLKHDIQSLLQKGDR